MHSFCLFDVLTSVDLYGGLRLDPFKCKDCNNCAPYYCYCEDV